MKTKAAIQNKERITHKGRQTIIFTKKEDFVSLILTK